MENISYFVKDKLYGEWHPPLVDCNVPMRAIRVIVQKMDGVAHTCGEEIYLSSNYFKTKSDEEVTGVLIHEMVHVWQHSCDNSGLIEGIADYIRLLSGLRPPHWEDFKSENWDDGYLSTALFLQWIQTQYSFNILLCLNSRITQPFETIFGKSVLELWQEYNN